MSRLKKGNLIKLFFVFVLLSYCTSFFFYQSWKVSTFMGGDNWAYYSYLPAVFIHKDLNTLNTTYEARNRTYNIPIKPVDMKNRVWEAPDVGNGNRVIKYTMGVAAMQFPFFIMAHGYQKISGGGITGFEFPYVFAVFISVLFYVLAGLYFLSRVLSNWFNETTVVITLTAVYFATSLYYFTSFNIGMAHGYLFFWYCLLLYITPRFYDNPNWKNAVILGLATGMIALIRPSEMIAVLIPLLYGLAKPNGWQERINFARQQWKAVALVAFVILAVPLTQFYYWKTMTGQWLYDSYPGENFNFLRSKIMTGLFSFKNGWLSYTPVMFLAFPGIFFLWKQKNPWQLAISIVVPLHIYIIYSWYTAVYINGYSSRPMVEMIPLLSLALGALIAVAWKKTITRSIFILFLLFCITQNMFQTWQIENGKYYSDDATWNFYKRRLFKWQYDYKDVVAYDNNEVQPDENRLIKIADLAVETYEQKTGINRDETIKKNGNYSGWLTPGIEYAGILEFPVANTPILEGDYLKLTAWCYSDYIPGLDAMGRLVLEIQREGKSIKWNSIRISNKIRPANDGPSIWWGKDKTWGFVYFYVKLPNNYTGTETIKAFPWNPGGAGFHIDDLKIELWRKYK